MNGAYGLSWHICRRHRVGLSILVGWLLLLIGARHVESVSEKSLIFASTIFAFGLLYLIAIFTQPEADVSTPASGYPAHLFTLPLRTIDLVLWPMLLGAVTVAVFWVALAGLVLNQEHAYAPVLWPACMLIAALSVMQAVFWSPMRLPALRIVLAITSLPLLVYFGVVGYQTGKPTWLLCAGFLAIVPLAFMAAVAGVEQARRSEGQSIVIEAPERVSEDVPAARPFRSGSQAQFWLEFQRGGWTFPFVIFGTMLLFSVPIFFATDSGIYDGRVMIATNVYLRSYEPSLFRVLPFIAWIMGATARFDPGRLKDLCLPPLVVTRPITVLGLAWADVKARLTSAAIGVAVVLAVTLAWWMAPAVADGHHGMLLRFLIEKSSIRDFLAAGAGLLLVFAYTARNLLVGRFAVVSGRPGIAYPYMLWSILGPAFFLAVLSSVHVVLTINVLKAILVAILVLKAGAGVWALFSLRQKGVIRTRDAFLYVAGWAGVALIVYGLALVVLSDRGLPNILTGFEEAARMSDDRSFWILVIPALIPFVRPALLPLTLYRNRCGQ